MNPEQRKSQEIKAAKALFTEAAGRLYEVNGPIGDRRITQAISLANDARKLLDEAFPDLKPGK